MLTLGWMPILTGLCRLHISKYCASDSNPLSSDWTLKQSPISWRGLKFNYKFDCENNVVSAISASIQDNCLIGIKLSKKALQTADEQTAFLKAQCDLAFAGIPSLFPPPSPYKILIAGPEWILKKMQFVYSKEEAERLLPEEMLKDIPPVNCTGFFSRSDIDVVNTIKSLSDNVTQLATNVSTQFFSPISTELTEEKSVHGSLVDFMTQHSLGLTLGGGAAMLLCMAAWIVYARCSSYAPLPQNENDRNGIQLNKIN